MIYMVPLRYQTVTVHEIFEIWTLSVLSINENDYINSIAIPLVKRECVWGIVHVGRNMRWNQSDIKIYSHRLFTALEVPVCWAVTVIKHGWVTVSLTFVSIVTWRTLHVTCFVTKLVFTRFTVIIDAKITRSTERIKNESLLFNR